MACSWMETIASLTPDTHFCKLHDIPRQHFFISLSCWKFSPYMWYVWLWAPTTIKVTEEGWETHHWSCFPRTSLILPSKVLWPRIPLIFKKAEILIYHSCWPLILVWDWHKNVKVFAFFLNDFLQHREEPLQLLFLHHRAMKSRCLLHIGRTVAMETMGAKLDCTNIKKKSANVLVLASYC